MSCKVLHVVPTFYPATYWGGPIYSLYGLCNALSEIKDVEIKVLTTDSAGPKISQRLKVETLKRGILLKYEPHYCSRIFGDSVSIEMLFKLPRLIYWADVIHLTSVYSFPTIPTLILCAVFKKPLIWSPRGALQRWSGSTRPILKKTWEIICNKLLSPKRCMVHVTSDDEAMESSQRITRARMAMVQNGVYIPSETPDRPWMPNGVLRLLFIGRLHPKKGIENLLQALQALDQKVFLTVCGTGDPAYQASLQTLASDYGISDRVSFAGHVDGENKSLAFWNSDICLVPSYTENFAMVVAEALAHGVPVIASRGTPWQELVEQRCGIWTENDPSSLAKAIAEMRGRNLMQMGENGRQWMRQSFSWEIVAKRMHAVYVKLVNESR